MICQLKMSVYIRIITEGVAIKISKKAKKK